MVISLLWGLLVNYKGFFSIPSFYSLDISSPVLFFFVCVCAPYNFSNIKSVYPDINTQLGSRQIGLSPGMKPWLP